MNYSESRVILWILEVSMTKWEMVKLGDVLEYEQPTKYLVESDTYNSSYKTPVLTAGKTFILGYTNEEKGVFSEIPVIIFDDFTTATKYVDFSFKVKSSAMKILRPTHHIHLKYIFYQMSRIKIDTQLHKRYWISIYSNIHIPLPPLEEQKKIAQELDSIQSLIAKRKEQLEKMDLLVKAKFVEMFGDPVANPMGWKVKPLSACLDSIDSGKSPVCHNYSRNKNEPAVLKLSSISSGYYIPDENKSVLKDTDFVTSVEVGKEDLLFSRKNTPELVGVSAFVFDSPVKLMMPDLIFRLNTISCCNKIYLWKLINHELFRGEIAKLASGSAKSMSNISKERLRNLHIPLPPTDLQNKFADYVQQTETLKITMHSGLEKLEFLYNSKIQEYFG